MENGNLPLDNNEINLNISNEINSNKIVSKINYTIININNRVVQTIRILWKRTQIMIL
jgi:hypothetical protein